MATSLKSVGSDKLVAAASIVTRRKPTDFDLEASESLAQKRRKKTTTEALVSREILLSIPTDEEALAYINRNTENVKKSTTLMARYASYGPLSKAAIDDMVKPH